MKTFLYRTSSSGKRWKICFAGAALFLAATGCEGVWPFESTNPDPHPPVLANFQYTPTNLETGESMRGSFTWSDTGADIETFEMRFLTSAGKLDACPLLPPAGEGEEEPACVFFFPGTTGTVEWEAAVDSNQGGLMTVQAWLTDSKDSISNVVEFNITITPPGTL